MINVFFDCEFTKLQMPLDTVPAELISIGCVSEVGKKFYAENADYKVETCSEFVVDTVLPLLDGGDYLMPFDMVAKQLKLYIESFDGEVEMWSDAPYFDWQHVKKLFDNYGWPTNLKRTEGLLIFPSIAQQQRFETAVEDAFNSVKLQLRQHHALDDAIANRLGFIAAKR
jgi:hypothetical protein